IGRCCALLVVVEIDVDVTSLPLPGLYAAGPLRKCIGTIMPLVAALRSMATNVDEIRRPFPGRGRVVVIRQAERDVSFRQQFQNAWLVPALITKFEAVAAFPGQQFAERHESFRIGRKPRRQLKQDGSRLFAEQRQAAFQQFEAVYRVLRQPLPMRDELRCLPGKDKVFVRLLVPTSYGLRRRCPIEHAIEFGGRELAGVMAQLLFERQSLRKERPSPRIVMPSRSADKDSCHRLYPPRATNDEVAAGSKLRAGREQERYRARQFRWLLSRFVELTAQAAVTFCAWSISDRAVCLAVDLAPF